MQKVNCKTNDEFIDFSTTKTLSIYHTLMESHFKCTDSRVVRYVVSYACSEGINMCNYEFGRLENYFDCLTNELRINWQILDNVHTLFLYYGTRLTLIGSLPVLYLILIC